MITVSLCMIVKNEEDVLARCLKSALPIVDEINVIDTGSSDQTRNIACQYTSRVFDFPWIDDFAAARNFSFSKATKDYILWLDADDVITSENQEKFLKLKETLSPDVDLVMMDYHIAFDANGSPTFTYQRERLLRRAAGFQWAGAIHEAIVPQGKIFKSDVAICHKKIHPTDPERNLRIFQKMIADGKELAPREQYYYARELYYHRQYRHAITVLTDFLNSGLGWVENCISACQDLSHCYQAIGDSRSALHALLRSLEYDKPRAEICCDIGNHFYEEKKYEQAIFWYDTAAACPQQASLGFVSPDCYGFIPYLQLCMCYYYLGDLEKAQFYNEKAGIIKPQDSIFLHNKEYFLQAAPKNAGHSAHGAG